MLYFPFYSNPNEGPASGPKPMDNQQLDQLFNAEKFTTPTTGNESKNTNKLVHQPSSVVDFSALKLAQSLVAVQEAVARANQQPNAKSPALTEHFNTNNNINKCCVSNASANFAPSDPSLSPLSRRFSNASTVTPSALGFPHPNQHSPLSTWLDHQALFSPPSSATSTFTATLPPPPSQLAKSCSPVVPAPNLTHWPYFEPTAANNPLLFLQHQQQQFASMMSANWMCPEPMVGTGSLNVGRRYSIAQPPTNFAFPPANALLSANMQPSPQSTAVNHSQPMLPVCSSSGAINNNNNSISGTSSKLAASASEHAKLQALSTIPHPLLNVLKPQLNFTDYLRPFASAQSKLTKAEKEGKTSCKTLPRQGTITIDDDDEEVPVQSAASAKQSTVSSSTQSEASKFGAREVTLQLKPEKSSEVRCCEFSSIPSTSAQVPSSAALCSGSSSVQRRLLVQHQPPLCIAANKRSFDEGSDLDLVASSSSSLSLASTSPAIQDPLSPAATYYSKHSINSSFDSFDSSSDMIIEHRHRRCHRGLKVIKQKKSDVKSSMSSPAHQQQANGHRHKSLNGCRKRRAVFSVSDKDSMFVDQCEQELYKMPRLVPEGPSHGGRDLVDDVENTAPPPMLDAFDTPSPAALFDDSNPMLISALEDDDDDDKCLYSLTSALPPPSPPPSISSFATTPSSSGVSSATSSMLLSHNSTPLENDSLIAIGVMETAVESSGSGSSSSSNKPIPAHERRRKYAYRRRKTNPAQHHQPQNEENHLRRCSQHRDSPATTKKQPTSPSRVLSPLNSKSPPQLKQAKIQPFLIKKENREENIVQKPNVEEAKKVPPMRIILAKVPSAQLNGQRKSISKSDVVVVKPPSPATPTSSPSKTHGLKSISSKVLSITPNSTQTVCSEAKKTKNEKKKKKLKHRKHGKRLSPKKKLKSKSVGTPTKPQPPPPRPSPTKSVSPKKKKKHKALDIVNSNWRPIGPGFLQSIRFGNEALPVERLCFHSIRHWAEKEEVIRLRDCVKICSAEGLENVGKIMHLFYDESSKALMATVLWFYTQLQVDTSKGLSTVEMHEKELLASRHIDTVNTDCIESLAFVLTVNEFCRFSAETKIDQLPVQRRPTETSELWSRGEEAYPRRSLLPHEDTPLELVYFCRAVYSLKTKRLSLSLPSCNQQQQNGFRN